MRAMQANCCFILLVLKTSFPALIFSMIFSCSSNPEAKVASEQVRPEDSPQLNTLTEVESITESQEGENAAKLEYTRYVHTDPVDEATQILDISWVSDDSVYFKFYYENMLCTYEKNGLAVNRYPGMDGESDEGENGMMYFSTEYLVTEEGQLFSLRIETPDKTRAKIEYTYTNPRDECDPEENYVMKKLTNTAS